MTASLNDDIEVGLTAALCFLGSEPNVESGAVLPKAEAAFAEFAVVPKPLKSRAGCPLLKTGDPDGPLVFTLRLGAPNPVLMGVARTPPFFDTEDVIFGDKARSTKLKPENPPSNTPEAGVAGVALSSAETGREAPKGPLGPGRKQPPNVRVGAEAEVGVEVLERSSGSGLFEPDMGKCIQGVNLSGTDLGGVEVGVVVNCLARCSARRCFTRPGSSR